MKKANRKGKMLRRLVGIFTGVVTLVSTANVQAAMNDYSLDTLVAGAEVHMQYDIEEDTVSDNGATATEEKEEKDSSDDEYERQLSTIVMANVDKSVNVREEASEDAPVVGKLYKDCGGSILERHDGWTKLKSGELEGWTKDEFLLFGEEALAKQQEVGKLKATILTDALRVRKEPGEDAGVYKLAKMNDTLTALEEQDEWVKVELDEETQGYVAAEFVSVAFCVETGKTIKQIEEEERAKELAKLTKNRGAIPTSVSDVELLAALIQCEAGGQPYDGQVAVGAVVMNRVRNGYGGSILAVITAKSQFPPATNGKVAAVLARGPKASCLQAAQAAVNGATTVGGATHFARAGSRAGIVIGNHVFW